MSSGNPSLPSYYLKAGELFIMEKPALVSTVLGSCIAVTLFNRRLGFAGICHALLPQCKRKDHKNRLDDLLDDECHKCLEAFRYADCSVFMMAEAFSRFDIKPQETEASLFGGAKMMPNKHDRDHNFFVGRQNVDTAVRVLDYYHLKLTASDVGGSAGRRITFNTGTGEVVRQFIKQSVSGKAQNDAVCQSLNQGEVKGRHG